MQPRQTINIQTCSRCFGWVRREEMKWTTETPVTQGWYFTRVGPGDLGTDMIYVIIVNDYPYTWREAKEAWLPMMEDEAVKGGHLQWAGPIPLPEEP